MIKGSRRVLEQVVRANGARERLPELLVLRERLDSLLLTMRLAMGVRAFKGFKAYSHMVEQVSSVCRQNEGWIKCSDLPEFAQNPVDFWTGAGGDRS